MYFDYVIAEIHSIMRLFVHYSDVIMSAVVPQITSLTIIYSTAYSAADKKKHQSFASQAFVRGIHRWPVNSPTQRANNMENVPTWWRHHI